MNNRAICVSISGTTVGELRTKIDLAEKYADVIEIRYDALDPAELYGALNLSSSKPLLLTYRPASQGGKREISHQERLAFRDEIAKNNFPAHSYLDTEHDLPEAAKPEHLIDIRSFHDFETPGRDLRSVYDAMVTSTETIGKIAVTVDDAVDAADLWKLMNEVTAQGRKIIAIAMGEAGKWTRILGPAYGSILSYASLDATSATAAGQLTADDLANVYRVNELNRSAHVYALLAGETSYSVSPYMHNAVFSAEKRNAVFLPIKTNDIARFFEVMVANEEIDINFRGFAVTNPYKQTVMKFVDNIDKAAEEIGAVNTIKIVDRKLFATNTDAKGFIDPLVERLGDLTNGRVAVVGAGGAARACVWALKQQNADVTIFARNISKARNFTDEFGVNISEFNNDKNSSNFHGFDIVVNTTPLGTRGANEKLTIASADGLRDVKLAYDLTYNPAGTLFLAEAEKAGAATLGGLEMLVAQGIEQHRFWYDGDPDKDTMKRGIVSRLNL